MVETKALFVPDPAKEAWVANVLSVPPVATTTAAFEATAAETAVGAYETELATIRRTIVTTAAFSAVAIPVAVLTTLMLDQGALKGVTDAIGSLVGHISSFVVDAAVGTVKIIGSITDWQYAAPCLGLVAHITDWVADQAAPGVSAVGHITDWVLDEAHKTVDVIGHITSYEMAQAPRSASSGTSRTGCRTRRRRNCCRA